MAAAKIDYEEIAVKAAFQVLLELAHLLQEYQEGIVLVGGWVPDLSFVSDEPHIGSIDVDLALDQHIINDAGYRTIMQLLRARGYEQDEDQPYIFYRSVIIDGISRKVEVDFLAGEYGGTGKKHRTQKVQDIKPRKARGCDLVFDDPIEIILSGSLPGGGKDSVVIRLASAVPFLVMKASALKKRLKEKDAYDINYYLTHYPGGLDALAEAFSPHLENGLVKEAINTLSAKFLSPEDIGPVFVRNFLMVEDEDERAFLQRDVFERMNYFLGILAQG